MDIVSAVAPQTKKRVLKDGIAAKEKLIQEQGIWYHINEADITKGLALLKGPEDSPYEGCFLLFSIEFPSDYPFSPPRVTFLTSDGHTRFHPNFYVDGKVCLSILGTFSGPSWSGTQTLTSVLLSLLGLLDANPLSHEPAFLSGNLYDPRHRDYADFVEHQMIKLMLQTIQRFEEGNQKHPWLPFQDVVKQELPSLKEQLAKKILKKESHPESLWGNVMYNMSGRSFWKKFVKEVSWIAEKKEETVGKSTVAGQKLNQKHLIEEVTNELLPKV